MGTPEIVVKRAWPCSSRFTPVGAPIGRSGAFSRLGARVFSAHFFSASEGWRFSNTSAMGVSATCGFLSMRSPVLYLDDREGTAVGASGSADRSVRKSDPSTPGAHRGHRGFSHLSFGLVPRLWRISTRRTPRDKGAAGDLRARRRTLCHGGSAEPFCLGRSLHI